MSEESDQERSLPATPRRLEQAREEGHLPRSRELGTSLVLVTAAAACWWLGPSLAQGMGSLVRSGLVFDHASVLDGNIMLLQLGAAAREGLGLMLPWLGMLALAACLGGVALGGWLFSGKAFIPDFSRLNPGRGLGQIFSSQSLAELTKAILKAMLIGAVAAWLLWDDRALLMAFGGQAPEHGLAEAARLIVTDFLLLAVSTALIAMIDVPWQLQHYHGNLRMSLEEIKREMRESEGDPHLKARVRGMQREAARKRMMADVPKADVVLVNPTHYAVALSYREGQRAPRLVAKGRYLLAHRIREVANDAGVPVLQAPPLTRALYRHAEVGADIPWQLYEAVALVLAWVMQVRAARGPGPLPREPGDLPVPTDWGLADPDSKAGIA